MPHRSKPRRVAPSPPPQEIPAAAKAFLAVVGVVVGLFALLAALWLTQIAMTAGAVALRAGDFAFVAGAVLLIVLAVASVTFAGPNILKGLPFHLIGTVGIYALGTTFTPFARLRIAGAIIYAAAWCWTYLGETAVRYFRGRMAARKQKSVGAPPSSRTR